MLSSLHIENIAVVKCVDLDFSSGFSALTGETGVGKSIIIDSINLLLGKKAEREIIRKGESSAMVSGLFSGLSEKCTEALSAVGVRADDEGTILVQRSIGADGRSSIKINGRSVSLSVLRSVSGALVNIHGQSDTHSLMSEENQLAILDTYADNGDLLVEYSEIYAEYESVGREIKSISERESERVRYTEMLEYQIKDIDSLNLRDGEEEELIDKKLKIKNSEKIIKNAGFAFKALKGSEKGSVCALLERSAAALSSISDVITDFTEYADKLRDFAYQVDDIAEEVYASLTDIDDDPTEKLNDIESRLDKISKIKRKYGLTVADVLKFREDAASELEKMQNSEDLLRALNLRLTDAYNRALAVAMKLHNRRAESAVTLAKSVCETLEFLDMPKVVFTVDIKQSLNNGEYKLTKDGIDAVSYLISANRGQDAKPISRIASGGELARIMLALKNVIADKDGILTIVFDEIDAGVSGKTARKIGIKMQALAKSTQVLCVTHSAQIASLADSHFLISKADVNGITESSVAELDYEGRIGELSRILGGINITDAQREAAVDMLKEREIYKNK